MTENYAPNEIDDWLSPTAPRSESEHDEAPPGKSSSGSFPARILVVDDDEALLVTTAAILLREGYDVRTARDGFEALTVLRGSIPDLLISDLNMPNMSGFELLAVVRKRSPPACLLLL